MMRGLFFKIFHLNEMKYKVLQYKVIPQENKQGNDHETCEVVAENHAYRNYFSVYVALSRIKYCLKIHLPLAIGYSM